MRSFLSVGLALVGCLSLVGCAAEAPKRNETPVDDGSITPDPNASDDTSDSDSTTDDPVLTPVTNGVAQPVTPSTPPAGASSSDTPPTTPAPPTTPTPEGAQTQSCTSTNGDYKSVASVTYTVDNGAVKITTLTVDVTNPDARDKNDVDVYLTQPGSSEAKAFNSGDILVHSEAVTVPQATTIAAKTGTKLRLATNFDRQFLTDPSASCTIQF